MKYSILLILILLIGFISVFSHKAVAARQLFLLPLNSMSTNWNQKIQQNTEMMETSFKTQIRQDLYNSIFIGMSYNEVSAIVGWDGVLIYENHVDEMSMKTHEQVYLWNYDQINPNSYKSQVTGGENLYWSVTLNFQDNILVEKSSFNLKP
jgi:hypothetical protein